MISEELRRSNERLRERINWLINALEVVKEKNNKLIRTTDTLYRKRSEIDCRKHQEGTKFLGGITFIIVVYNITPQLHRTLISCSPEYQEVDSDEIEIILVDNGSKTPLNLADFKQFPQVSEVVRVEGCPSPVNGLNIGISKAKFSNLALMIDGAHMLSPGVVKNATAVLELMPRPVINIPQYLLGSISQNLSSFADGFENEAKDLAGLGWPENGYVLFDYAVVAGEHINKQYLQAVETNCLITTKEVISECGAYDERFDEAAAGLANIEIFIRLSHHSGNQYVVLPGEGSFHQDHCGTTTGIYPEDRTVLVEKYFEKYRDITGETKIFNFRAPFVFGEVGECNVSVPSISLDYVRARNSILKQLSSLYIDRARKNLQGDVPELAINKTVNNERKVREILKPLGLLPEKGDGEYAYYVILKTIHEHLKPQKYLEIGVDAGGSLRLAKCPSIGIDPDFMITAPLNYPTQLFRRKSEKVFSQHTLCENLFKGGVDLVLIDGMHLAENVIQDFINVEKWANEGCAVVIDDVYPEQLKMVERKRFYNAWCGDVYKVVSILKEYRPTLDIHVFEAFSGPYRKGLAVISNLDPLNTTLKDNQEKIRRDILSDKYTISSISQLEEKTTCTDIILLRELLATISSLKDISKEKNIINSCKAGFDFFIKKVQRFIM